MNNKQLGKWGEDQAVDYLKRQGYVVIAKNFTCPLGEIDIIARDGEWIVFVEVKTRRSINYGYPAEAVNFRKQGKNIQTALYYLKENRFYNSSYRFDIIEVMVGRRGAPATINHIPNAFYSRRRKYFF